MFPETKLAPPSSSQRSFNTSPFGSPPFASSPSDSSIHNPAQLHAVPITDHIPVKLSHTESNYHA